MESKKEDKKKITPATPAKPVLPTPPKTPNFFKNSFNNLNKNVRNASFMSNNRGKR